MKIFIRILLVIFIISIAAPFVFTGVVYYNYLALPLSIIVWAVSFLILVFSTVLLTVFDKSIKKRYFYILIAFFSIVLFIFSLPFLLRLSTYLFIQRNEGKLQYVISEMRNKKIMFVYKNSSDSTYKIKDILIDLEIQSAQLTPDESVIFMEGGLLEADGWCYSETGLNPKKYYDSGLEQNSYQIITNWDHFYGNWYRWDTH